jgi:hypothetical protein
VHPEVHCPRRTATADCTRLCRHVVAGKYLIEGILPSFKFTGVAESVVVAFCDLSPAGVEVVSLTVATKSVVVVVVRVHFRLLYCFVYYLPFSYSFWKRINF